MRRDPLARLSIAAILVLASGASAAIAETRDEKAKPTPKPSAEPSKAKDEEPAAKPRYNAKADDVITNDDLERMMDELSPTEARTGVYQARPAKPAAEAAAGGAPPAPGAPGAKPAPTGQQVTDAEGKVAALQARVSELEKAVLAVKNPLLPRTWATPDSMKDQDQESGFEALDNAARVTQREAELKAAREELSKARQDLAALRGGTADEP